MLLACHLTKRFREDYAGMPQTFQSLDENPVPPNLLQIKAEEVWLASGGRWGTPPGVPLESYDDMCKSKGLKDVSPVTKGIKLRDETTGRTTEATDIGVGDEYVGIDPVSGQAAKSEGT